MHVRMLLPQQQMQMMSWHTIQLDCLQIKVWTVSLKGQIRKNKLDLPGANGHGNLSNIHDTMYKDIT